MAAAAGTGSGLIVKATAKVGLTLLALAAGVYLLVQIKVALVLTLAAAMLASALHHGVDFLRGQRMGRRAAIWTVILTAMVVGATVFLLLVPPAVGQAKALVDRAPELWRSARQT